MKNGSIQDQKKTKAAILRISASVEGAPYVLTSDGHLSFLAAASCMTDTESSPALITKAGEENET